MAQRRQHPYTWTTWLPRLLTSENSCEWAVWFKTHHKTWTRNLPSLIRPSGCLTTPRC